MKRFIITFCLLLSTSTLTWAMDYTPSSSSAVRPVGIGVCAAPTFSFIYSQPNKNSSLIEAIKIQNEDIVALNETLTAKNSFISFIPSKNIYYYIAKDENEGWCNVVYNKAENKSGWIKKSSSQDFLTWKEFFYKYGRENGLYFLKDVPKKYKKLRTAPNEDAQVVEDYIYPKNISLTAISGNWMLIKILDFGDEIKIGWINWRNSDGEMFLFPLFSSD